jgi:hypothetical protein
MTVLTNLVGPLYEAEGKAQAARSLINWFPEQNTPGTEYPWIWYPTPGSKTWVDTGKLEVRALYEKGGTLYAVADNVFYSVDTSKNLTTIGTLNTSLGYVDIAEGDDELLLTDGSEVYSYQITGDDFATVTDPDLPSTVESITFQDGYFIAATPDANTFYISNVDDGRTWDALDFGSKGVYGDEIVAVKSFRSFLYLFGRKTSEIHVFNTNAGTDFPFIKQQGLLIDLGCVAPFSISNAGDTFFWLARHKNGGYVICSVDQASPVVVSDRSMGNKLNELSRVDDCISWSYTQQSHEFVVFNFPTAEKTYVYDLTTGQWHERSFRSVTGTNDRHIGQSYAFFDNTHLIASRINGKILELDPDTYTDNDGDTIRRVAVVGPLESDTRTVGINNLHIQTEPGVGDGTAGQGSDPQMMLRVSRDFGYTWGNIVFKSPGKQGEYRDRILWSRVGNGRSLTLEISATDPVNWIIKGARAELVVGNS